MESDGEIFRGLICIYRGKGEDGREGRLNRESSSVKREYRGWGCPLV